MTQRTYLFSDQTPIHFTIAVLYAFNCCIRWASGVDTKGNLLWWQQRSHLHMAMGAFSWRKKHTRRQCKGSKEARNSQVPVPKINKILDFSPHLTSQAMLWAKIIFPQKPASTFIWTDSNHHILMVANPLGRRNCSWQVNGSPIAQAYSN